MKKNAENSNTPPTPSLDIAGVSGSDLKRCQNCKFHNSEKISCSHEYWRTCIVRDAEGYVTQYRFHHYR